MIANPHPTAVELAEALQQGDPGRHGQHLYECVECRVRNARLVHVYWDGVLADSSILSGIVDGSARVGAAARAALGPAGGSPRPGEVWRVGDQYALLVWVRKVLDGAVDVVPVSLDVEFADEQTIVVRAADTGIGEDLALFTALRAHVHPDAFVSRVTALGDDVGARVDQLLALVRQGRTLALPGTGSAVHDRDDQLVEYQQVLVDLLGDLGPASWRRDAPARPAPDDVHATVRRLLAEELVMRHRCRVHGSLPVVAALPGGSFMTAAARVAYADTSVVVAVLADWQSQSTNELTGACRRLLDQEPGADAVAVCSSGPDLLAVVIAGSDMRDAYEPPAGVQTPPRAPREPLWLVDALAKYLDSAAPAWRDADASALLAATDLHQVAQKAARAAVDDVVTQGRMARTPAKVQAWTALTASTADTLSDAVGRIVAGESVAAVLSGLVSEAHP